MPSPGNVPAPARAAANDGGDEFRLGYRPALDGLRALAVLAVFGIHFSQDHVPGGWVGVDVFFVLSGFLITCLLLQEWQRHGRMSLTNFYVRRALRLLPALFVLLAVTWFYVARHSPPWDPEIIRQGVVSALGYFANFRVSGHLDRRDLLIRTWSLSVEEQFYFVWPVVLAAMLRWRLSRRTMLSAVALGIVAAAGWRAWL